ncbi:hypothetical protein A2U01_0100322, partial [Trifolium medium]|nr:hypothetical protein [Trifolium medium]
HHDCAGSVAMTSASNQGKTLGTGKGSLLGRIHFPGSHYEEKQGK